jgi:hypothetical protein
VRFGDESLAPNHEQEAKAGEARGKRLLRVLKTLRFPFNEHSTVWALGRLRAGSSQDATLDKPIDCYVDMLFGYLVFNCATVLLRTTH